MGSLVQGHHLFIFVSLKPSNESSTWWLLNTYLLEGRRWGERKREGERQGKERERTEKERREGENE